MTPRDDETLKLSGIQHFVFCRRQWALIHIESQWLENDLTASGRLVHERVHDRTQTESRGDELTVRAMPIKSEKLGVSGECDAVVFRKCEGGFTLAGRSGMWSVLPVEYKHGKVKADDCDTLQVTAQAMCLEEMFCCRIDRAALFYHETRNREYVEITDELRERVRATFAEMHEYLQRGYTPKVKPTKQCGRCSIKDICLPGLEKTKSAAAYIRDHIEEGDNEKTT